MLFHRLQIFNRAFSTSTKPKPKPKPIFSWRTQYNQNQFVSQISSTLLQRQNWVPLLRNLNLSSKLTPSLFLQVLHKIKTNPQLSLSFFNWARQNLGFQPDLKTLCKLAQLLIGSGHTRPVKPILDSLTQTYPPTQIVDSLIQACKGTDFQSPVLSSVLECYCNKGLFLQALEVFGKIRNEGYVVPIHSCNQLLELLQQENEIRLAWCFYCCMLRNGILTDKFTWSIVARILCKDGKFERVVRILDMGVYSSVIYNLIIDCYSKRGEFRAAFDHLNEMKNRKLDPGFSTYSSILDGACKFRDAQVIGMVIGSMVEKGLLLQLPLSEYGSIIQKLSDLGNTYAAKMFFDRACTEKIELQCASYGCLLKALSKVGRVKEAIGIYRVMLQNGIIVKDSCYNEFVHVLCKEDPSEEIDELLRDVIKKGFSPCASELSKYISSQCDKGRWNDTEELLNEILEKGFLPDSLCCSSLIEHYISNSDIDSAITLQNKIEKLGGSLDLTTYNVLLNGLFREKRAEEAVRVFDYMRRKSLASSESFSIMISGLCVEKDLRKAMKMHDEMLKMGLKPDKKTYKRLIRGFR